MIVLARMLCRISLVVLAMAASMPGRAMADAPETVLKATYRRERGFVYFLRGTDVYRMRSRVPREAAAPEVVQHGTFTVDQDWLYFLDSSGDVVRAPRWPKRHPVDSPKVDVGAVQGVARTQLIALEQLARLLGGTDAEAVVRAVRHATVAPADYLALHKSLDGAGAALPRLALLEALDARDRLAEIDWKSDSDEIDTALRHLVYSWPERPPQLGVNGYDEPTEALLRRANDLAMRQGAALVYLSIGSDTYPMVVVPKTHVTLLRTLVRAAGYSELGTFER